MKVKLSERLHIMADWIRPGQRVADIGTDHGYLPMYLLQEGISSYVVAGDVHEGPLGKLAENMEKYAGDEGEETSEWNGIFPRLGSGLDVIAPGEVDVAVIAGMGGWTMREILEANPEKTASIPAYILQPRNGQEALREWLLFSGFSIRDERLAREGRFLWEILYISPTDGWLAEGEERRKCVRRETSAYFQDRRVQYEIGQWLIRHQEPYLSAYIERKCEIQRSIMASSVRAKPQEAIRMRKMAEAKIQILEEIKALCQ